MEKMKMESIDGVQSNIDKIAELFPNCITEALDTERSTPEEPAYKKAINWKMLHQMLSNDLADENEAYEMTWVGKKAAIIEANKPIRKTLRPCQEESVNWDTTENLYIEGDNLEVLKLLQESYLGRIDLIYMDPPYNTGQDFIYNDTFMIDSERFDEETGAIDENGLRLYRNNETSGRFHSDWCSMIYSRLLLSRKLLSPGGVIAISIGYQEVDNLMKICSELFTDKQVMCVTVQTSGGKLNGAFNVTYEYVVFITPEDFSPVPIEDEMKEYASPYHGMNLTTFTQVQRPNQAYPIYISESGKLVGCGKSIAERVKDGSYKGQINDFKYDFSEAPENCIAVWPISSKGDQCVWRLIPERLLSDWEKGYIKIVPQNIKGNENKFSVQYLAGGIIEKIESGEFQTYKFSDNPEIPTLEIKNYKTSGSGIPTIWTDKKFYTTNGGKDIRELFGGKYFSYPKPLALIKNIVKRTTGPNSIVMDIFSGSATTAHACIELNNEDGYQRKFILVQLPEAIDTTNEATKAGFKNICEIGKQRIRLVGKKSLDQLDLFNEKKLDLGFRDFKIDSSNMADIYYHPNQLNQQLLFDLESNIKADRTDTDLFFGCILDWGLPLSLPYSTETIGGFKVHNYNNGDLIACFEENVSEELVKEIASRQPMRAVFRDSSFGNSPEKTNVFEIFKKYMPEDADDISKRVKVI